MNSINASSSCPIHFNSKAYQALNEYISENKPSEIVIITDENTEKYCLPYFLNELVLPQDPIFISFEAGEQYKTLATCIKLFNQLSDNKIDKKSLILNLGGGVVTDLGGFVASVFKRGLPYINIPTTILAMVDASVGGKTGVDFNGLKNQIGLVNNGQQVVIDVNFLKTLPKEQLISGYAEMLKHGLIHSELYWNDILLMNLDNLEELHIRIWESVVIKNDVVTKDPYENNLRKILNYGHTLGHAIESYCMKSESKKSLLHGEAIAIGLILETYISTQIYSFPESKLNELVACVHANFMKVDFSFDDIEAIIDLLIYDKKNVGGKINFVLLKDIGQYELDCQVSNELIYKAFEFYKL